MNSFLDMIEYKHNIFELTSIKPTVWWKPEAKEWIDYNLKFPVEINATTTDDGVLTITPYFYDIDDATLFTLFWL